MRTLFCGFLFAAFLPLAPILRADSASGPNGASLNGEQIDERQRLAQQMLETFKTLAQIKTNYVGDESKLQFRLVVLGRKLRQTPTPQIQSCRTEIRDLRRDFMFHVIEVKSCLSDTQLMRQVYLDRAPQLRKMSKGFPHHKKYREAFEKWAQSDEKGARDLAVKIPKYAKELRTREELSRILADLDKLLDDSWHR